MSTLALDLQATLRKLDPDSATKLERLVRDAMDLAGSKAQAPDKKAEVDANGWPVGYFEETSGSFAGEPFDFPAEAPLEPSPSRRGTSTSPFLNPSPALPQCFKD